MNVMEELQQVFRSAFNDGAIVINHTTTAKDVEEWDSLSHVGLVLEAEKRFGIRFNTAEIALLENVGEFVQIIRRRTGRD
jgi:acyl carrier protein